MSSENADNSARCGPTNNSQAFYGEITASVTHELNNVFGIIEQISGLLEDFALAPAGSESALTDRITPLTEKITRQIDRGIKLVSRLNRFAHLADEVSSECDLCEVVENLTTLTRRLATLRGVSLQIEIPEFSIMVVTSPFHVSEVLFYSVKRALALVTPDTTITIRLEKSDGGALIRIEAPGKTASDDPPGESTPAVPLDYPGIRVNELQKDEKISIEICVVACSDA